MEKSVRRVSGFLPSIAEAVAGALVSGPILYFIGLHNGRWLTRYERRAETVTGLRRRLRETRDALVELSIPTEDRLPGFASRAEQVEIVAKRWEELTGYHHDHAIWLDARSSEKLYELTDDYAERMSEAEIALDDEDEEEVMRAVWDWLGGDQDRTDEVLEALDRSLRNVAPWWRRMFG